MTIPAGVIKDTADIRTKLLEIWKQIDEKKISSSEARLLARVRVRCRPLFQH